MITVTLITSFFAKLLSRTLPTSQFCLSLTINKDGNWILYVLGHQVNRINCKSLSKFPSFVDSTNINLLLYEVDRLTLCCGQPDSHFVEMVISKNSIIMTDSCTVAAFVDEIEVEHNGKAYPQTIQTSNCEIIISSQNVHHASNTDQHYELCITDGAKHLGTPMSVI